MGRKKIKETAELQVADDSVNELFRMVESGRGKKQIGYLPSLFTTASLPFRNINRTIFVRKGSNGVTLTLSSPKNVPYGRYGRLLLSILTTHAVISQNKDDPLMIEYGSMSALLRELQLPKQRGRDIREQLECFSSAAFTFDQELREVKSGYLFKDLYKEGEYPRKDVVVTTRSTGNIRFTTGVQYQEVDDGLTKKVGRFKILLSPEFCEFCIQHAVPIDYEVYKNIDSPIGKDLYAWLVFRNNGLRNSVFIPRHKLVEQFIPVEEGRDSNLVNVNYSRIVELLKEIKERHYPEVQIDFSPDGRGITLHRSPAPILKEDPRYALITTDI